MKIKNITKNTIITEKAVKATSFVAQTKGLLESSAPYALILSTRFGIHTFGMKFPIDVIILDKKLNVISVMDSFSKLSDFIASH